MTKFNKFAKRMTTAFAVIFTTLSAGCDSQNGINLPSSDLVQKFMVANKCEDSYLLKSNLFGQDKFLRCKVQEGEQIRLFYDDTFLSKEKYLIEKSIDHFNKVFNEINPEIQIVAKEVDSSSTVGFPANRNEIYVTKNSLQDVVVPGSVHTGGVLGVSHGRKELASNGEYYRVEQKIRMDEEDFTETSRRTSKFFGSVFMHELLHCFGLGDAYLFCDADATAYLEKYNGTIMFAGKEENYHIGTNDYKALCGLYGNYTESTLFAYKDKIETYENYIADYKKEYKENYDKEWKTACNIANGIYEKLENAGEKGYVDKYVDINDYLCLENTKTNEYYKFIGDETYSIYNKNTKTTQNLTYKDSYFLTKISDDKCLMAVDDNYLVCDTATEKVTTVLNKISLDQYNTAVGIKSTSTEPDLSM